MNKATRERPRLSGNFFVWSFVAEKGISLEEGQRETNRFVSVKQSRFAPIRIQSSVAALIFD